MNPQLNDKEKRVVPQWLEFSQSTANRELDAHKKNTISLDYHEAEKRLELDLVFLKANPNPTHACDLLSSAITVGEHRIAEQAAKIVASSNSLPTLVKQIASDILKRSESEDSKSSPNRERIRIQKRRLLLNPVDAVAWVERARLHAIEGQEKVATKCLELALSLQPTNRYVVRSASRYFLHIGDIDRAFQVSDQASKHSNDPWIAATRLSIAQIGNKNAGRIRLHKNISAVPETFSHSEYVASIGMLEAMNGRENKAKQLFSKAWKHPSKNVISHAEWVMRKMYPNLQDRFHLDLTSSSEADTCDSYFRLEYSDALKSSRAWMFEEPYSERPFMFSSSVLSMMGEYQKAIDVAERGLQANPHSFQLTNNLLFSLLMENNKANVAKADELHKKLLRPQDDRQLTMALATTGFYMITKGYPEEGLLSYERAIEAASKTQQLQDRVRVYLALAKAIYKLPGYQQNVEEAIQIADRIETPDFALLKKNIVKAISPEQ